MIEWILTQNECISFLLLCNKLPQLKTIAIHCLTFSMSQEFGYWLAGFSVQDLTRPKSNRCLGVWFHLKLFLCQYDLGHCLLASCLRAPKNILRSLLQPLTSQLISSRPAGECLLPLSSFLWFHLVRSGPPRIIFPFMWLFHSNAIDGNFDHIFKICFSIIIQSWEL